ncbi:hypothetical protein [Methylomagnum sp.]
MKASLADFDRYFKDKGASEKCPFCGCENWILKTVSEENDFVEVAISNLIFQSDAVLGAYYPVVVMICSQCGFARQQDLQMLQDWQEKNNHEREQQ